MDLEKIVHLSEKEKGQLKEAFSYRHCNPLRERCDLPYLKYSLTDAIARAIIPAFQTAEQMSFSRTLYSAVNKNVLKRVNYGIRSTGNLPINFITTLTRWEGIYFFRGRWEIKNPNLTEPVEVIIAKHLLGGLEALYRDHYVRKAKGEYETSLKLPEDRKIREQCRKIIRDYESSHETEKHLAVPIVTKPRQGRFFPTDFPRPD